MSCCNTFSPSTEKSLQANYLSSNRRQNTFAYDPITPVYVIYNQVKDLVEYGEMTQTPFTTAQTINIAYAVINHTTKFKESIKVWNRLPALQKTWKAYKLHSVMHITNYRRQENSPWPMQATIKPTSSMPLQKKSPTSNYSVPLLAIPRPRNHHPILSYHHSSHKCNKCSS
jgi:hypothetical protein